MIQELKLVFEDLSTNYEEGTELINNMNSKCNVELVNMENILGTGSISSGYRLSPRTIAKMTDDELKKLATSLFDCLRGCRESLKELETGTSDLQSRFEHLYEDAATVKLHEALVTKNIDISNTGDTSSKIEPVVQHVNELEVKLSELSDLQNSQLKELQDLKSAVVTSPPLDYSRIKFPPQSTSPAPAPTPSRKEIRASQDALQRRNNVVIRGLPCAESTNPVAAVKAFLNDCNIEHFKSYQNDMLSAHILNRVGSSCTIRAIFHNQWAVNHILNSAHKLKTGSEQYQRVYLHIDRSPEELIEHKKLLTELRVKITDEPSKRWVILEGKVVEKGHFVGRSCSKL